MRTEFTLLLESGDVDALCKAWRQVMPHLPLPKDRFAAEVVMHHARTQAQSVTERARFWSHRWLLERSLPSGLPDMLRPKAERLYPVNSEGVGIAILGTSPLLKPVNGHVQNSMEQAVLEVYADYRQPDPAVVRKRMMEKRDHTLKKLLGIYKP